MRAIVCVGLLALWACGGDEEAPEPEAPQPEAETEQPEPGPEEPEPEPETPTTPPIDLLKAVGTEIATSSAYRDREAEVAKLIDGNLETAWNSRTGDLQGAWIDVRVPADAQVTSIQMTVGYTKTGETDLFTGNHRVARVRVLRDGAEIATHALDTDSRELQSIPVEGAGGVYRIELAEVVAGSREDWREACVSEIKVMGRAPDARENARFPRYAIGALPETGGGEVDTEGLAEALRLGTHQLYDKWAEYEYGVLESEMSVGDPGLMPDEVAEYRRERRRLLERAANLVTRANPAAADPLRAALVRSIPADNFWRDIKGDMDVLATAMSAAAEVVGDDAARCRWAKTHARLRLNRLSFLAEKAREYDDMEDSGDPDEDVGEIALDLLSHGQAFSGDAQTTTRRLLRMEQPRHPMLSEDWPIMRTQLEAAQRTCGWD